MKNYGVNELRKVFLDFFEKKDHLVMKSFSLVPQNDNSLLLINAGMAPLKPYFTGQEIPPKKRVATCQKCVRTGDIDNVGKTARHMTFFEMLGNFSFGDYFKEEALTWSWEFLTQVLQMDADRLYPSIYGEDEEAFEIWTKKIGVPAEKITRFYRDKNGECDNFWEHGAGPCGPCSEIYYDRGEKYGCHKPDCKVGCDCDRYMEIWNNVFTQFEGDGKGNYKELSQKNIDTGMGLERLAVVVQGADSVYDIDTVRTVRDKVCALAKKDYGVSADIDASVRLVTDHIRSAAFLVADGVMPGNEGRSYVLRRLIRRAIRHGRKLEIAGTFLSDLADTVIAVSADGYPELKEKREFIVTVLKQEEEKFDATIDQGLGILTQMQQSLTEKNEHVLSGADAFKLYDTFGFPLDLTCEILAEKGFSVDEKGFQTAMQKQKETARKARKETNYMGVKETVYQQIDLNVQSTFVGYDNLSFSADVNALTTEDEVVLALSLGQTGTVITDKTPFYATMGGQAGDVGTIVTKEGKFLVKDTIRLPGQKIGHVGTVLSGMIKVGDKATLQVDEKERAATCKNHSATHLLQKALRTVLGSHVEQAGSYVDANRLRFDFSHFSPMTKEQIREVEELVNQKIEQGLTVVTEQMPLEEAKKTGAMALFGEKYGDIVRVVRMGDFSTELCGGTHVKNTGDISYFKIISESGVASGVRRIEALTGTGLISYYRRQEEELFAAAALVKAEPENLAQKIKNMQEQIKTLQGENESLHAKLAAGALSDTESQMQAIKDFHLLCLRVPDEEAGALRTLGDSLKEKVGEGVVVLASEKGGKVSLLAMATPKAVKAGANAGDIIKQIAPLVGGGGGGRRDMAQAGGKNPGGIDKALKKAAEVFDSQV